MVSLVKLSLILLALCGSPTNALSFTNIATDPTKVPNNIRFPDPFLRQRMLDYNLAVVDGTTFGNIPTAARPGTAHTHAGISVFDFNGDGYDDIFIAQAEGKPSELLLNKFGVFGQVKFVDVAASMGVDGVSHDSTGSCVADVDNDGDLDLVVLGNRQKPLFYRNRGGNHGFEPPVTLEPKNETRVGYTSCVFGDVNGDGYNDLIVANGWDPVSFRDCTTPITTFQNANILFINHYGLSFVDESSERGYGPGSDDKYITWAVMAMDYDQDGDLDIIEFDDQCGIIFSFTVVRGIIRVMQNDGTGNFMDVASDLKIDEILIPATDAWMGACNADFNGDGELDFFATNFGSLDTARNFAAFGNPPFLSEPYWQASRVFLSTTNATTGDFEYFDRTRVGFPAPPGYNPFPYGIGDSFGFGVVCQDLDNDGNSDVAYMGGMLTATQAIADNPGVVMLGDGAGSFSYSSALNDDVTSQSRGVKGLVFGDFNDDGYPDLVSVSSIDFGSELYNSPDTGGLLQPLAGPFPIDLSPELFTPNLGSLSLIQFINATHFRYPIATNEQGLRNGSITVQINGGGTNGFIKLRLRGTLDHRTPRDGLGSVVTVTPCNLAWNKKSCANIPGLGSQTQSMDNGGSSMSSFPFTRSYGLGSVATHAAVRVKWMNSVENYYIIREGKTKVLPQINCDVRDDCVNKKTALRIFKKCLNDEMRRLKWKGIISSSEIANLKAGMLLGFKNPTPLKSGNAAAAGVTSGGAAALNGQPAEISIIIACVMLVVSGCVCLGWRRLQHGRVVKNDAIIGNMAKEVDLNDDVSVQVDMGASVVGEDL